MKRVQASYVKGASLPEHYPPASLPEIALAGRSNVGKSSFLNALCGQKDLARVSKTPGRTRDLHFFDTNYGFRLVDLPGYGFAKAAKTEQSRWRAMLEEYFASGRVRLVVSLLDARHPATPDDESLHRFLRGHELPWEPLATKIDKLTQSERARNMEALRVQLGLSYPPLVFSAATGEGRERVLRHLAAVAAGYSGNPQ